MNTFKEDLIIEKTKGKQTTKMKAIVCTKYGSPDYLQVQSVDKPVPKENEVLIKVHASTVTRADTMMRRADPFISRFFLGLTKPKHDIMGTGVAGEIVAIGKSVSRFQVGDAVFGETGVTFGANAEFVSVAEDGVLLKKPESISHEVAATLADGPLTSINFLKMLAKVKKGQKVLINGASGSLGTAAVQLAKHFGVEVTGVCGPTSIELVKSLGADQVIDYTKEDFTTNGLAYDVIYDTVGTLSFNQVRDSLTANGIYLSPVLDVKLLFHVLKTSLFGGKKAKFSATGLRPATELRLLLSEIKKLVENERLKLIIDRSYALEEVTEAHRYVDAGHKKGNVVIKVV